jgi:hypothetical protein
LFPSILASSCSEDSKSTALEVMGLVDSDGHVIPEGGVVDAGVDGGN